MTVTVDDETGIDRAALLRLVSRAARPIALPRSAHVRFVRGGARPTPSPAALTAWIGSPGRHRAPGDVVLPDERTLAPALAEDGVVSPSLDAALGRFGRALAGARVGVALSGGGAWCYAHVAFLRALDRAGVPVDILAGSSLGAAIAALYAQRGVDGLDALLSAWRRVHLAAAASVVSSRALELAARHLLGDVDLAELGTAGPLVIAVCTDLDTGDPLPLRHGPAAVALRASCSFPGAYGPASWEGRPVADGALSENVPVRTLRAEGASLVAASVAFPAPDASPSPFRRVTDAARAALLFGHCVSAHLAEEADVVFAPALSPFRLTDWHCAHAIVDRAAPQADAPARRLAALLPQHPGASP